jgi:molybdate transport system substrate-binding protein
MIVMCSGAFIDAFRELLPAFEQSSGLAVTAIEGSSLGDTPRSIPRRLRRGETADMAILFDDVINQLISEGVVFPSSKADLASSSIGVAVRAGAFVPDIGSLEGLTRALVAARSIAYSSSRSGTYVSTELLARLGVGVDVGPKAYRVANRRVGDAVADGDADMGFQQLSELLPIKGITVLGPIPDELQQFTILSAGVPVNSTKPGAARALVDHLTSVDSAEILRRHGLKPI